MKITLQTAITMVALLMVADRSFARDWSFELEPYVLASSIEGTAGMGRVAGADISVDFSDILEVLDIGFMGHFEAHHSSGWGVALDYGFMDLSDDLIGPRGGILSAKIRQGVLEAMLVRRFEFGDGHIDYLAGFRHWDNQIDVAVDPVILPGGPLVSVDQSWVDVAIGMRWMNQFSDKWSFQLHGDIGGFGLESDFTAVAATGFRFRMGKSIDLDLQYKALWVDFKTGSPGQPGYFAYDTVTHGPIIGVIFNW